MNLTDGEMLSSKCSDIFIDCERLDAVRIVSGQLLRRRQNDLICAALAVKTDPAICIPIGQYLTWSERDLVFSTRTGAALDAANVRREFKAACKAANIGANWTPRELRHSFVSLMSSSGVPVEEIARLAGHANSRTTKVVYRRELRPVLTTGAEAMDRLFKVHAFQ